MSNMFTDEDLTAFLDEECKPELASQITAALKTDVELRDRLQCLSIDKSTLQKAFIALPTPSATIDDFPTGRNFSAVFGTTFTKIAAGVIVGAALGVGAMLLAGSSEKRDWKDMVAAYQALYTTNTLAFVEQSESAMSQELARVSASLGTQFDLTDIKSVEALNYKRAQVLAFNEKPVIQLAFLGSDGKAFALCVKKSAGQPDSADVSLSTLEGLETASWSKDGYEYMFIGGQDSKLVANVAEHFQNRI